MNLLIKQFVASCTALLFLTGIEEKFHEYISLGNRCYSATNSREAPPEEVFTFSLSTLYFPPVTTLN